MNRKQEVAHFRVTESEASTLERDAMAADVTVSELLRRRVFHPEPNPEHLAIMGELRFQRTMLLLLFDRLGQGKPLVGSDLDRAMEATEKSKLLQAAKALGAV